MLCWIKNFLSDRRAKVRYGVAHSKLNKFEEGVPQGCVLSPTLFTVFINDISYNMPAEVKCSLFADDLAFCTRHKNLGEAEQSMQDAMDSVVQWSLENKMEISVEKTEQTLFTTDNKQKKTALDIRLNGVTVKFNGAPKCLGVKFDQGLTFREHIDDLCKTKNRIKWSTKFVAGTCKKFCLILVFMFFYIMCFS